MSGLLNSLRSLAGSSSSKHNTGEDDMRFSVSPNDGTCGWNEWLKAMKLVARLPAGIPVEFRKKLWLTLAEQHLKVKGVDWTKAEKTCFSEWTNPDDTELGVQIVKDLHRTGCSLFCGTEGRENQAVLKRVLLGYARWNKAVGYCQGFNMLAALILEVMDRSESDSLKVMIYLIEAVLPESYFANNLRGLSVDMAVFRDLLKLRLPRLSAHLDKLQKGAAEGSSYEPPLTNVFTMQWFLTLFCNCLPRVTVLRVWDLIFLEGDEILLTTALAIWDTLQDRILQVESADEFYSVMGELARQTLEAPPSSTEILMTRSAQLGPVPELSRLRDKHRYNITPWAHSVQSAAKKGLRLFYSEDETDSSDEGDKLAITTAYGLQASNRGRSALVAAGVFGHPDREKLALDISALKQQYARLRERQRQAHIILAAACARQPSVGVSSGPGPLSVNHLLLGKSAIVSARGRRLGPPQGAIPPSRVKTTKSSTKTSPLAQPKADTLNWKEENTKKNGNRRDSIRWKDIKKISSQNNSVDEEVDEDNKTASDTENVEISTGRRKSESSSYSECSESSTSTSLCDEPNRMSDFDSEPASSSDNIICVIDDPIGDDINNVKLNKSVMDSKTDSEKIDAPNIDDNDKEFGNYIQEFEDLLDRTNDLEEEKNEDVIHETVISIEKNTPDEVIEKTTETPINNTTTEPSNTFAEFVDSSRGEPLRNYLDEFRKADAARKEESKREKSIENTDSPISILNDSNFSLQEDDKCNKGDDTKTSDNISLQDISEISQTTDIKNSEGVDESISKPLILPDYHSSCERSISSSIGSISPILRCISMNHEDTPAYTCYKSPTRFDSEPGSDFSEDEKPIVLKIDKYFEHSPEFFGARKSGAYVSSDEEDEPNISHTKRAFSSLLTKSSENIKAKLAGNNQLKNVPKSFEVFKIDNVPLPDKANEKHFAIKDDESEDASERLSKKESPEIFSESNSTPSNKFSITKQSSIMVEDDLKSPDVSIKSTESARVNILEKTKSEDLPRDPKRPFSLIDDEIEAIRSQSGRRNSERALKIIQENSKILHRILINQVKTTTRDTLQESINETSNEESSQKDVRLKDLNLYQQKSQKTLPSPRSASLDDNWPRKKTLTFDSDYSNSDVDKLILKPAVRSPSTPTKISTDISPTIPKYTAKSFYEETSLKSPIQTKVISDIFEKNNSKIKIDSSPQSVDENKTDMFGWENKGFNVNQRLTSFKNDLKSPCDYLLSKYIDNKGIFGYDIKEKSQYEKITSNMKSSTSIDKIIRSLNEVELHLNPLNYQVSGSDKDKESTLTAVSDTFTGSIDYSNQELTDSWRRDNNNSFSNSYNLSSPYKFTYRSTENSSYIDGALKSVQKFNDSPLSRVSDSFSRVTECSPLDGNIRGDSLKFENSQSSDLCIVSSSMSFSFDPSVDGQPSSKPTTFNSSDTLCQVTSLDQISTPISPKITTYPSNKEFGGASQNDLSLEIDKFKLTSEDLSLTQGSFTDPDSICMSSLRTPTSPTSHQDRSLSLKSPDKMFNPFPARTANRQPKELGLRLGLYKDPLKSPTK